MFWGPHLMSPAGVHMEVLSCCWLGAVLAAMSSAFFLLVILCRWSPNYEPDAFQSLFLQFVDCLKLVYTFLGIQCINGGYVPGPQLTPVALVMQPTLGLGIKVGLGDFWLCHSCGVTLGK